MAKRAANRPSVAGLEMADLRNCRREQGQLLAQIGPGFGGSLRDARTELDISFDDARHIDLNSARLIQLSTDNGGPTHNEVRRLFSALRLPMPAAYGDADIDDIVKRALHHENTNP